MRKIPSALALGRDGAARYLPYTIGLKVFFAALALAGVLGLQQVAELWKTGAFAVVTVELAPDASAEQRDAALEVMQRTVGVASAEQLDAGEVAALLQPWLGVDNVPADLPLPVLIDVRVVPGATVDWDDAIARLAQVVPEAELDTGMVWVERLVDFARLGQFLALLVLCFVTGIAVLTVVFATRAGLAIHRDTVDLMHLLGANDSYLAREFQWQALWLGLRGGVFGVLPAIVVLVLAGHAAGRLEAPLLPAFNLGLVEWGSFAVLPVISALLAMITARVTVLRELGRMT